MVSQTGLYIFKELTLGSIRKLIFPPLYKGQVGGGGLGGGWNPSPEFMLHFFLNDFTFSEKPLIVKMRYILGVVALLEAGYSEK